MAEQWIKDATSGSSKGYLHRALGISESKKIPAKRMAEAARSKNPRIRSAVARAHTLAHLRPK